MIRKLHIVAIASTLLLSVSASQAAELASAPKLVNCGVPDYPREWLLEELQGTVRLAVLVGADGAVKDAKVIESSGYRELDKASRRASATCKLEAASKDDGSAPGWTAVQYTWVAN